MRLRFRYPLASGPEGVTLEGRKMAMAGTGGAVNERGSMPTPLNDTKVLDPLLNVWNASAGISQRSVAPTKLE